jgi:hypothetical protein
MFHYYTFAYYSFYCNYCWLLCCRLVGICRISGSIRTWLQKAYTVRRSHSEYPGQTSFGTSRWHWNYSAPNAQRLSGRSRRPQAGRRRWVPDVIRQLVGIGMVPWHVINLTGFQRAMLQGESFHVNTTHGRKVPCEHDAMFGQCYRLFWLSSGDSTWFSRQCLGKITIRPNIGLCSVPLV